MLTIEIQNALIDATCIADFRVDDLPNATRVSYTVERKNEKAAEAFFSALEADLGLFVADAGVTDTGFFIVYTAL